MATFFASAQHEPKRPPRRKRGWLRWTGRIFAGVFGLLCLLAAAGAIYNAVATARDRRRFPPPGRLVSVERLRLHLDCRGEGSPTVVFESGLNDPTLAWTLVQPEVARFTRACSYDRAGLGYSDEPQNDHSRDGRSLVEELHALLSVAGVTGPYILVGHRFGGFLVRLFAATYPAETAGVVLVDATHEEQLALSPATHPAVMMRRQLPIVVWVTRFGILRLGPVPELDPRGAMYRRLRPASVQAFTFLKLQTKSFRATIAELRMFEETLAQTRAAGMLGDLPVIVLAARTVSSDLSPADAQSSGRLRLGEFQPKLARLSTRGHLVVVDDSEHNRIPFERPDTVLEAVRAVVDEARR